MISFLLGLTASTLWHFRASSRFSNAQADGKQQIELSDRTKAVLTGLTSPVEIRFYSLLDPTSTSESLQRFASRVDQLLSEYQQEAGDKFVVKRFSSLSDDADAASTDGIKSFNFDKGDPCFLGLVIACNDREESFGELLPQWEAALESDLTRAIERVTAAKPVAHKAQPEPPVSANVLKEVKEFFPNLADVSLENGTQMLREAGMTEFQEAMKEGEKQMAEATQRLVRANNTGSEAERQAALKQLQQIQAEQTEKLSGIAGQVQARITAFEKLKAETR